MSANAGAGKKPRRKRSEQFFGFIESPEPLASLQNELESMGMDLARVDLAVSAITGMGRAQAADGWLARARAAQSEFERGLRNRKRRMSQQFGNASEILTAIASGSLGNGVQRQAHVFFRNQDLNSASESDLRSFLDDCELLGLVEEVKK